MAKSDNQEKARDDTLSQMMAQKTEKPSGTLNKKQRIAGRLRTSIGKEPTPTQ